MSHSVPPSIGRLMQNVGMQPGPASLQSDTHDKFDTHLTIDATSLFKDLLDPISSDDVYTSLANIESLCIRHVFESPVLPFSFDVLVEELLNLLRSLPKLQHLNIDTLVRPHPGYTPSTPISFVPSPLRVNELTISDTHGQSLTLLLNCIQAESVTLETCRFTDSLPVCRSLTLRRTEAFPGLDGVLSKWIGHHLMIQSSSFVDEKFLENAMQRMQETGERIWPGVEQLFFVGYPHEIARKANALLKLRAQL